MVPIIRGCDCYRGRDTGAGDDRHADFQYPQDYTPVVNLEDQDDTFLTSFLNGVGGENVSAMNQTGGSKQTKNINNTSTKPVKMKRTVRASVGTSMFRDFMSEQNATQKRALELLLDSDTKDQVGVSNRDAGECFQRSRETISRAFHDVLEAITSRGNGFQRLAHDIIRPKDLSFRFIPSQIMNDQRYMPYFKGSTHDTRVFLHALNTSSLNFPKPPRGKYYLVDKGYPDRNGYLVPYSKTRYHQSQFENEPPNNMREAFNHKHSSLRSYIERSFGVLKKRWKILGRMPKFSVKTQIDVIIAAFALHNYIRNSSQEDMMFTIMDQHRDYIPQDELHDVPGHDTNNEHNYEGSSNEMK
ncbi:putative nuclease HARBI1 [Tanacetum coccineum]